MSFTQGGGGGRATNDAENNLYALDKPYDLAGLSADTLQQINEMFDILFRNMRKAKTEIDAIVPSSEAWTTVFKSADQDNGQGNTTFTNDTVIKVTLPPNTTTAIRFDLFLWSSGNGTQGGMKIRCNTDATVTATRAFTIGAITTMGTDVLATALPTATVSAATNSAGQAGGYRGTVFVQVSTGGTFNIESASNGSGGTWQATVGKGSWIQYKVVA